MPKNMDSRCKMQVKIDSVRKAQEVLNLKGNEISQSAQNIGSLYFLNHCLFWAFFLSLTLNCHIFETLGDFDQIPTLRARPKYQLSSGSLVVEDYMQQNQWDYA